MDEVIKDGKKIAPPKEILESVHKTFIATAMGFERRAIIFREIHPLALQIILYSGVLNGILVTRSVDSSAKLLNQLIENNLELYIEVDENNYKLIEKSTRSIIRVISRNELLSNSFLTHYSTTNQKY